jgi:hypothetical protein
MERPYKYSIFNKKTQEWDFTNITPSLHHLQTWEPTENPKIFKLEQTKECYIDTRYEVKKRLFEYLHPEQKIKYNPFDGTEVGKTIPILNF